MTAEFFIAYRARAATRSAQRAAATAAPVVAVKLAGHDGLGMKGDLTVTAS